MKRISPLHILAITLLVFHALSEAGRGRPVVTLRTIVSDKGTLLRGPYGGIDKWFTAFSDDNFMKLSHTYGFNLIHIYGHPIGGLYGDDLKKCDMVVSKANAAGMYVVISYAHLNPDPNVNMWRKPYDRVTTEKFWKEVAARYKDNTNVFFETTNEPDGNVEDQVFFYKVIRSVAPKTPICIFGVNRTVEPSKAQRAAELGVDYKNALISYHNYHGEKPISGYPTMCTEFSHEGTQEIGIIKNLEIARISWSVFIELTQSQWTSRANEFKKNIDAAHVTWVPDYGTWPLASGSTPVLLEPIKRYSFYEQHVSTVLSIKKQNSVFPLPATDLRGARLQSGKPEAAGLRIYRP